jgi:hypothetical protein
MRTSTAFFAGVGTVVAAIAAGLGGGLLISNIVNPHEPKTEMSKLELRMSSKPIPVTNAPSEPVPNFAATESTQAQNQQPAENTAPAQAQAAASAAANAALTTTPPAAPPPATPVTQAAPESANASETKSSEMKASEGSFANARDADVRRDARQAEDKRKAERRQRWAERHRYQPRQDEELREVEQRVREKTEPVRSFTTEPARLELPRIQLFGDED